ncbi:hypothetical protein D3C76_1383450 [compost metagenome]
MLGLGAGVDPEVFAVELEGGLVGILEAGLLLDRFNHHFRLEAKQLLRLEHPPVMNVAVAQAA